ncbi:MAG: uracil-DNA glycosylase [Rikenellaceae bacterium]
MLKELIPNDWAELLSEEFSKRYFIDLEEYITEEYATHEIFPLREQIFRALEWCSVDDVKVVILGQDPYHDVGQANGLCFSVADGVKFPPSLRNIFKEVNEQMGSAIPTSGNLEHWARQGILMLNAVLTVRAHQAASHSGKGWEIFTDALISALNRRRSRVLYMLWGNYAKKKAALIDNDRNAVQMAAHPSPLSFRHRAQDPPQFIEANNYLRSINATPIEW